MLCKFWQCDGSKKPKLREDGAMWVRKYLKMVGSRWGPSLPGIEILIQGWWGPSGVPRAACPLYITRVQGSSQFCSDPALKPLEATNTMIVEESTRGAGG